MKYRDKQKASNNYSESDIGCVKSYSEQKMSEMGSKGQKYSHDNPKELKKSVEGLEKAVR